MITVSHNCSSCKAVGQAQIGEIIRDDYLCWYRSFTCSRCGLAEEADDIGRLPESYRQLELEENSTWILKITCPLSTKILYVLRSEEQLAFSDISTIKRNHQDNYVVAKGTQAEMTLLKAKMSELIDNKYLILTSQLTG